MPLDRPKTNPQTPIPKEIVREARLTEAETDIEWIKASLARLESRPHICVQERYIESLMTWRKIVGSILAAFALTFLGIVSTILVTCQQTGHAQGVTETRIEDHSRRISSIEKSLTEMDQARRADTLTILEAIRESRLRQGD